MYLVFDIGGTFIKHACMNGAGETLDEGKFPTPYDNTDSLVERMATVFFQTTGIIEGIAISCPGKVDVDTGIVFYGGALKYLHEQNLAHLLKAKCDVPVSIENDGKCAALAEWWIGSVKGFQHAAVLVLGTGVGGGIIIDGKLHRGSHLEAGEVSYVMDGYDPETNIATFVGESGSASKMVNKIAKVKQLEVNDGESAFRYIIDGDVEATKIFTDYCKYIAVQILNLQYMIDPEIVAIGGGISVQPIVLEGIKKAIHNIKEANPHHVAEPKVVTCTFRSAANIYGALYHHLIQEEKV